MGLAWFLNGRSILFLARPLHWLKGSQAAWGFKVWTSMLDVVLGSSALLVFVLDDPTSSSTTTTPAPAADLAVKAVSEAVSPQQPLQIFKTKIADIIDEMCRTTMGWGMALIDKVS